MAGMDIRSSHDVDRDFAALMIPHHQGAIDMAVLELRYGRNEQLRRLAQEIIVNQQQEIMAYAPCARSVPGAVRAFAHHPSAAGARNPLRSGHEDLVYCHISKRHVHRSGLPSRQAPFASEAPDIPVSHADRVYAAEQLSNTVSVIDPASNQLLGVIRLGETQPANFSPAYRGQVLVHGMGFLPDPGPSSWSRSVRTL